MQFCVFTGKKKGWVRPGGSWACSYSIHTKKGERVWDIDTRAINFLVQSFSSPYSKDQHKEIWINAEIFLCDRSTTPNMLNMNWFLHCSAPDLCEFFKPAVTFWCHGNQIHYISGLSHRDKWVHGSNGRTITSYQFVQISCSWLFLRRVI